MKKKTLMIIVCATATVILVSALCIASLTGGRTADAPEKETASSDVGVIIDDPETEIAVASVVEDETVDETETEPDVQPDDGTVLTIPDEDEPEPAQPDPDAGKSAGDAASPIVEQTPPDDGDGGGVLIGETQAVYDCGSPGHHCEGPETHAYVLNLETEGCPYCGRHICPSFYAVDEWGNTCYTPRLCPEYDVTKDPACFCQVCGRECGDGSKGTCVQFVTGCKCPICGEQVEAWTCHTCG